MVGNFSQKDHIKVRKKGNKRRCVCFRE